MKTKYTEIFRLRDMLDNANIEYIFKDNSIRYPEINYTAEHYQIEVYRQQKHGGRIISVIEGDGSYGREDNLLEIMGCLTPEEVEHDCVKGWLTAEEVFARIEKEYKR